MSALVGARLLPAAHLVLVGLALLWNISTSGRIAKQRDTPRPLAMLSGVAGLAILPALVIALASTSMLEGRSLFAAAWIWPLVTAVIALQAVYAVAARLVAPPIGTAIAAYDIVLAVATAARYAIYAGAPVGDALVALAAAPTTALGIFATPFALAWRYAIFVPLLAPAGAGRPGFGTVLRSTVALVAAAWLALMLSAIPESVRGVQSYARYDGVRLQERSSDALVIGLKILPALEDEPSPYALASDLGLADSTGVGILALYIAPRVTNAALDSLARAIDEERGGKSLLVALDTRDAPPLPSAAERVRWLRGRLATIERVMRRLRPDYLVPVVDPFGAVTRALGALPRAEWERYHADAAALAHRVDQGVTVLAHAGGTTPADSALFAWATGDRALVDGAAVTLMPFYDGAATLDARMATVDRWMRATPPRDEVWVLESGGYPMLHGERSQAQALWGTIAWATRRPAVSGVIVSEAGDYDGARGVRAPGGRLRSVRAVIGRAITLTAGTR